MKYSITIILASLTISVILAIFLFLPAYNQYKETRISLEKAKTELEGHRDYQKKLEETNNILAQKSTIMDKVNSALPDEVDMASFLNFLDETAKASGSSIENVSWQESSPTKARGRNETEQRIKNYNINLDFSASYFAFKNFLYTIESSARLVDISSISFDVPESMEKAIFFKTSFIISSY